MNDMENGNQPAFAQIKTSHESGITNNERWHYGHVFSDGGLTKREYFTGLAMQGLLSNPEITLPKSSASEDEFKLFANVCVKYADEILKQLQPPSGKSAGAFK